VASTDGFELAEIDLDLRGEGTIMGERQKGQNDLRLASLRRDKAVVAVAREAAINLVDSEHEVLAMLIADAKVMLGDDDTDYLLKG